MTNYAENWQVLLRLSLGSRKLKNKIQGESETTYLRIYVDLWIALDFVLVCKLAKHQVEDYISLYCAFGVSICAHVSCVAPL